jgi:hypothetical protein
MGTLFDLGVLDKAICHPRRDPRDVNSKIWLYYG